jgi:probable rRNA maturation factor
MVDIEIDEHIQSPHWNLWLERFSFRITPLLRFAFNQADWTYPIARPNHLNLSLIWTDDAQIQVLNATYRTINKPTNVLSFCDLDGSDDTPQETPLYLGDIVLAFETITQEALEQDKSFEHHSLHLVVHGFLHLLGYDHQIQEEADLMETLEIMILDSFGIPNPY